MIRLTTSLPDDLGKILYEKGLDDFLSVRTQVENMEKPLGITFTNPAELWPPYDNPDHIDFQGAYGQYYRELYFHIPFLIANHLNANQKFKEAKYWYEKIFDPTAIDDLEWLDHEERLRGKKLFPLPTDRNWQYVEFRNLDIEKLKEILTDEAAIKKYRADPFNPHAIARLRLNAYQKAIVMKYIDNLLDWGDHLFARDTYESINEATMLYVLASDILGSRPVKLGKCETASDDKLTYEEIGPKIESGSEFLISLENWNSKAALEDAMDKVPGNRDIVADNITVTVINAGLQKVDGYKKAKMMKDQHLDSNSFPATSDGYMKHGFSLVQQSFLAFCIPQNKNLLDYWDRVEDRLYKIRHCMNIKGIRRQLALFQPPIDPMMLVRARAAGLSLEDILSSITEALPPYRFAYLVEKAKSFAGTVQGFGSALLSALEKKDTEELALLRSVHEQNILKITRDIKKNQIKEAKAKLENIKGAKVNVENRKKHYDDLIEAGLIESEFTQQDNKTTATMYEILGASQRILGAMFYLIPQLGSPFAMKYGGLELGNNAQAIAEVIKNRAAIASSISSSAGLEATFQRREQEWKHQQTLLEQEEKQIDQQIIAAEMGLAIAEKDIELHKTNVEQTKEVYDFYKDKFTNLGLYNYLATSLNRLYREAYNLAYDMAKMCERTYRFERDDNSIFIENDNWQVDKSGLLAGERLLLQLQRMEKTYIENNVRDNEINQSFSLALLDASELVKLRQTGSCTIKIPEIAFEVYYPGQYKRIIKSVRISIPCVVGPYTNVSARLTLMKSEVEVADNVTLTEVPVGRNTSISASSANNDTGMFEFSFRDERYLPFEGSGAISEWTVELPSTVRSFNYDTIPDVIMHISYTAKDGDRETAESNLSTTITTYATEHGLFRLFSLKHEFPNAFHQLLNPQDGGAQATEISVDSSHFPYLFIDKTLNITEAKVYFKPKKGLSIISIPTMGFNGVNAEWNTDVDIAMPGRSEEKDKMKGGTLSINGRNPIDEWTINTDDNGLDGNVLEDILILIKYRIS